jgi:acetolactate synthase regulatory subunit
MVRQWQELFHQNRLSHVELDTFPDAGKLAGAYGLRGLTLEDPKLLAHALQETASTPGPCLLNVKVAPYENVFPMVPSGAGIHEMVLGPEYGNRESTSTPAASPVRPHNEPAAHAQKSLVVLVENATGALQRILTIVTAQCCAVKGLSAIPAAAPDQLTVSLTLEGDEKALSRVAKRVSKLVNVLEVAELQPEASNLRAETTSLPSEFIQLEQAALDSPDRVAAIGPSVHRSSGPSADPVI